MNEDILAQLAHVYRLDVLLNKATIGQPSGSWSSPPAISPPLCASP